MTHFVVIGLGSIGRRHATNLAALHAGATFTFVRHDGDPDGFARAFDARVVTNVTDALSGPVHLAVLATPSAAHVDALPELIAHACPLLVEKPIVTGMDDCDRIAELLRRAPAAVRVAGFNLRHLPSLQRLRSLVHDGGLGTIVRATLIAGQWLPDWRPGTDYRASYSADAQRGGGVELDLSHEFDVARWLFGDLDVDFARGACATSLGIRANDTAVAVLSPRERPVPMITVALDYVSRRRVRWYEVVAEGGRVQWSLDGELVLATADGSRSIADDPTDFDVAGSYVDQLRNVMRAVSDDDLGGLQSLEDGLASTRLALAVRDRGTGP